MATDEKTPTENVIPDATPETPVAPVPELTVESLQKQLKVMETKFDSLVGFVNDYVTQVNSRVGAIDNVAFAALSLHDGKEYVIDATNVARTRKQIDEIVTGMNKYREDLQAAAEKAREKEQKAAEKKAAVQAKRDAKKGKTKDATTPKVDK